MTWLLFFLISISGFCKQTISILSDPEMSLILEHFLELGGKRSRAREALLLETNIVNAFAARGDLIAVFTGLIKITDFPNFLSVLMHEQGHLHHKHLTNPRRIMPVSLLSLPLLCLPWGAVAALAAQHLEVTAALKFSRTAESQADQVMASTFYEQNWPLLDSLKFLKESMFGSDSHLNPYWTTHPITPIRLSKMERNICNLCKRHNTKCFNHINKIIRDSLFEFSLRFSNNEIIKQTVECVLNYEHEKYFLTNSEKKQIAKFLENTSGNISGENLEKTLFQLQTFLLELENQRLLPEDLPTTISFVQKNAAYPPECADLFKILKAKAEALMEPLHFLETTEHTKDPLLLYVRAWAYVQINAPEKALLLLESISDHPFFLKTPRICFVWQLMSLIQQALHKPQEAIAYAKKSLSVLPNNLLLSLNCCAVILDCTPSKEDVVEVQRRLENISIKKVPEFAPVVWMLRAKTHAFFDKQMLARYCLLERAFALKSRGVFDLLHFFDANTEHPDFAKISILVEDIRQAVYKHRGSYV